MASSAWAMGRACSMVEDAGLGQHHQMSAVDQPEPFDMVILGPVEKRTKHGLLVDRIGKDGRVVERACSHRL